MGREGLEKKITGFQGLLHFKNLDSKLEELRYWVG